MPSEIELAWAAGIVDGEGCVSVVRVPYGHRLQLDVGNTSLAMVTRLHEIIPGRVYPPYADSIGKAKPRYQYRANGKKAEDALRAILPYLVVKKAQAVEAITFFELNMDEREDLCVRLQSMKKVG